MTSETPVSLRSNFAERFRPQCARRSRARSTRSTRAIDFIARVTIVSLTLTTAVAADLRESPRDKFSQLDQDVWPTPDQHRTASGSPGPKYWQQRVDYRIEGILDERNRSLSGAAEVTYENRSPHALTFLWLLLDQNAFRRDAAAELTRVVPAGRVIKLSDVRRVTELQSWRGGFSELRVTDDQGTDLPFKVIDTLMRVDLPQPVEPGGRLQFRIEWTLALPETASIGDRSGYECFTEPGQFGRCIFHVAQWFPRLAPYTDYGGWHNQPFLIDGEFPLEFGDYEVAVTVPESHVVAATGELQNPHEVLSKVQRERLLTARTTVKPVYVITPSEATQQRQRRSRGTKTWRFKATNVRDFAFASSPTFIWDAMGVSQADRANPLVVAMSFYPDEARPLWSAYATKAIAHTVRVFGGFAFPYPYPVVQAVNGPVNATEFPMITCINLRPTKDRRTGALTYSERNKSRMVSLIIHEIGHNWFPMIVNSDERRWMWLDEGITSFLQFEAEKLWDPAFPSRRGEPETILDYMRRSDEMPIMTEPDLGIDLNGANYRKPAAALVVLRETVLGREVFDRAFREYANKWRFKRPTPYDFFRTMEELSGHDLDWFWRGWFYSTDHVDVALERIERGRLNARDPQAAGAELRRMQSERRSITVQRNASDPSLPPPPGKSDPAVRDFYDEIDRYAPTPEAIDDYRDFLESLTEKERSALRADHFFYRFTFRNVGGLVTPLILKLDFVDGSSETIRIPAHVWRRNTQEITWQYVTARELATAEIDPDHETADVDRSNNHYRGRIGTVLIGLLPEEESDPDLMRLHYRQVTPDSLQTLPSPRN